MKAAILYAPNDMQLAQLDDPVLQPGDLILRVRAATICGTDIRVYRGRKTAGIRYPSVIGHEFCGEIVATGGTAGHVPGMRVGVCPAIPCGRCGQCLRGMENLCPDLQAIGYEIDGAFAEYIRIPARAVEQGNVHVLSDTVKDADAALIEPLACVLNGQNKVGLQQGDTVVILGAGPIGALHVKLARLRGASRVIVSEPNQARRAAALVAGADVVICAIGIPALAAQAVGLAAKGGRVSLFAGFTKGEMGTLDINAIHYDELRVTGSFGLSRRDYEDALNMVTDGRIDLRDMVTHRYALHEVAAAFAMAESGAAMKVVITDV